MVRVHSLLWVGIEFLLHGEERSPVLAARERHLVHERLHVEDAASGRLQPIFRRERVGDFVRLEALSFVSDRDLEGVRVDLDREVDALAGILAVAVLDRVRERFAQGDSHPVLGVRSDSAHLAHVLEDGLRQLEVLVAAREPQDDRSGSRNAHRKLQGGRAVKLAPMCHLSPIAGSGRIDTGRRLAAKRAAPARPPSSPPSPRRFRFSAPRPSPSASPRRSPRRRRSSSRCAASRSGASCRRPSFPRRTCRRCSAGSSSRTCPRPSRATPPRSRRSASSSRSRRWRRRSPGSTRARSPASTTPTSRGSSSFPSARPRRPPRLPPSARRRATVSRPRSSPTS